MLLDADFLRDYQAHPGINRQKAYSRCTVACKTNHRIIRDDQIHFSGHCLVSAKVRYLIGTGHL